VLSFEQSVFNGEVFMEGCNIKRKMGSRKIEPSGCPLFFVMTKKKKRRKA